MLDIEEFSSYAWATHHCRLWNGKTKRGILYRGWARISDSEWFFANELRAQKRIYDHDSGRGFTWGT